MLYNEPGQPEQDRVGEKITIQIINYDNIIQEELDIEVKDRNTFGIETSWNDAQENEPLLLNADTAYKLKKISEKSPTVFK